MFSWTTGSAEKKSLVYVSNQDLSLGRRNCAFIFHLVSLTSYTTLQTYKLLRSGYGCPYGSMHPDRGDSVDTGIM